MGLNFTFAPGASYTGPHGVPIISCYSFGKLVVITLAIIAHEAGATLTSQVNCCVEANFCKLRHWSHLILEKFFCELRWTRAGNNPPPLSGATRTLKNMNFCLILQKNTYFKARFRQKHSQRDVFSSAYFLCLVPTTPPCGENVHPLQATIPYSPVLDPCPPTGGPDWCTHCQTTYIPTTTPPIPTIPGTSHLFG